MNQQQEKDIAALHIRHAQDWAKTPCINYASRDFLGAVEILGVESPHIVPLLETLVERLPNFTQTANIEHTFPIIRAANQVFDIVAQPKITKALLGFKKGLQEECEVISTSFKLSKGYAFADVLRANNDIATIFDKIDHV